jgi:N6-adenosine-specific RNA methylase IME4
MTESDNLAPASTSNSRAWWAAKIGDAWRSSVAGILEAGRLTAEAKEAMPHGEFEAMVEHDLPFGPSTARRLMIVAADRRLADRAHAHVLPPSWMTLYELTKLENDVFAARLADGTINPEMQRRDITNVIQRDRRQAREAELGTRQRALPDRRYGVIVADPEWRFEPYSRETGMAYAADNHYPTSELEVIKARPVPDIAADDCSLWLWATVPMLPQALEVMVAWGFTYKSSMTWVKDRAGTGYWFRNQHELLLLGTRGNVPAPAMGSQWSSVITAPVGEHSAKPETFLEMIEGYFPNLPKIELNRRGEPRPGWDAWGFEAEAAA